MFSTKNTAIILFSVLLLFSTLSNLKADDINPPNWAGSPQSAVVFWEFNSDSDQPTYHHYVSGTKNGDTNFGFRYYSGCWTWQSGGYMNMPYCEESLVQPIPAGTGSNITVYFQVTWQGDDIYPPLRLGPELWLGYADEHMDGYEVMPPSDDYTAGDWRQTTWEWTFYGFDQEVTHFHVIFNLDEYLDITIDEVVIDMVIHDGATPPDGPGREGMSYMVGNTDTFNSVSLSSNRAANPFIMPEHGEIQSISMWNEAYNSTDYEMILGLSGS
jgi:hypothetical protein